jgi:hypothetical protein
MKEQKKRDKVTIGLDLGERRNRFCVLGCNGEVVEEGSLLNERVQLSGLVGRYPGALVVMEAATFDYFFAKDVKIEKPIITQTNVSDHLPVTCAVEF